MRNAASLGGTGVGPRAEISVEDSGDTEASAVAAAERAVAGGANMLLGPLFSGQSRAVAAAVGRDVTVVSLSNDTSIAARDLVVFGVTPLQSAKSVFGFAAGRGIGRIGMMVPPGAFGQLSIVAARTAAEGFGITLNTPVTASSATGVVDSLRQANGGVLPDAVYLPITSGPFAAQAAAIGGAGIQILGSDQWSTIQPFRIAGLQGSWFAAPDPIRFEAFALAMEQSGVSDAGIIAGLAFDAVEMARLLGRIGQQNREGLTRQAGFDGVLGPFRILENGQCERGLAILGVAEGAVTLIGTAGV